MGLLKKIKKTVRKAVPKELSGIMRAAAPFVAASNPMAALGLTIGGQLRSGRGRISPLETVLALAPSDMARDLTKRAPGGEALDKFLYGTPMKLGESRIVPGEGFTDVAVFPENQGIFGTGGKFGLKEFVGSKLLSPDKTLSKPRLAALATAGVSLAAATKQIEQEAVEEGVSDSDIDALTAEAADFWSTLSSSDFAVTPTLAKGGRVGFALGTRPTAQESGLGGLPIEADMRYTGGFMPYGAKEKADDVPARLSKNEFVFTADAVRAAGGGSVQKGAQRMYNTMKQLEAMGKA